MSMTRSFLALLIFFFTTEGFANCQLMGVLEEIAALEQQIAELETKADHPAMVVLLRKHLAKLLSQEDLDSNKLTEIRDRIENEKKAKAALGSELKLKETKILEPPPRKLTLIDTVEGLESSLISGNLKRAITIDEERQILVVKDLDGANPPRQIALKGFPIGNWKGVTRISPDGNLVAVSFHHGPSWIGKKIFSLMNFGLPSTRVFDLNSGRVIAQLKHAYQTGIAAFGADSQSLIVSHFKSDFYGYRTAVWNFRQIPSAREQELPIITDPLIDAPGLLASPISSEGLAVVKAHLTGNYGQSSNAVLYDFKNMKVLQVITKKTGGESTFAVSGDGRIVLRVERFPFSISLMDKAMGEEFYPIHLNLKEPDSTQISTVEKLELSHDGTIANLMVRELKQNGDQPYYTIFLDLTLPIRPKILLKKFSPLFHEYQLSTIDQMIIETSKAQVHRFRVEEGVIP